MNILAALQDKIKPIDSKTLSFPKVLIFLGDENTVMKIEFLELKGILLVLKEKELVKRKIA